MKKLTTLVVAGAIALGACSTTTTSEEPIPVAAPTTTADGTQDTTTTEAAVTTTEATTTTVAAEPEWLSEMTEQEQHEAVEGACYLVAFSWAFAEPITAEQWVDEYVALISQNAPSQGDIDRAVEELGHLLTEYECPDEFEGTPIPDGVDDYLQEVSEVLLDR
jgi:cell division septation protein DedD